MALCRRADDRKPEARPRLAAVAAPEATECLLGVLGREPFALVGDGEPGEPVLLLGRDRDPAVLGSVELRVLDQIFERALQRRSIAFDGDGLEAAGRDPRAGDRAGELVELDHLRRLTGGFL